MRSAPIEVIEKRWHMPNGLAPSPFRVRPSFHRNSVLKPGTSRALSSLPSSARRPAAVADALAVGVLVGVVVATIDGDGVVGDMVGVLAWVVGEAGVAGAVGVLASVAGLDAALADGEGEGSEEPDEDRSAQPVAVSAASTLRPTANRRAEVGVAGPDR